MAIQKKSLIGKRQSVKKALVAKRVSTDASKATQIKAPHANKLGMATRHFAPMASVRAPMASVRAPMASVRAPLQIK